MIIIPQKNKGGMKSNFFLVLFVLGALLISGCMESSPFSSTATVTPTPTEISQTLVTTTQQIYPSDVSPTVSPTIEKPLPLTETYTGQSFSFKYPQGYRFYEVSSNSTQHRTLFLTKTEFADAFIPNAIVYGYNTDTEVTKNLTFLDYNPLIKQSVLRVVVYDAADEGSQRWISNALIHDNEGNTYWKTYQNASSDDVEYNNVKWVRVVDENVHDYYISYVKYAEILKDTKKRDQYLGNIREKNLADFKSDIDIDISSTRCIDYFLRYRTPTGTMVWFEYQDNAKLNGESLPKDGFNEATFEEMIKSFTIIEN